MKFLERMGVKITGVASALPEKVVHNEDISRIVDTSHDWIFSRTGIEERRVAGEGEGNTSLSLEASKKALDSAGVLAKDLDLILSATSVPDYLYPSTACEIQGALSASKAVAFNVVAACSGFLYALKVAEAFLSNGTYKKALITGCDVHSRCMDWSDRSTCILFGDGAGAMVLEADSERNEFYTIELYSDGTKAYDLTLPFSGVSTPFTSNNSKPKPSFIRMNGREIYRFSLTVIPKAILETLEKAELSLSDIDYFIPHQANFRIIEAIREKLGLREEQMIVDLKEHGNTSSASIPLALSYAIEKKKINSASNVMIVGFGAGLTWGVAVLRLESLFSKKLSFS